MNITKIEINGFDITTAEATAAFQRLADILGSAFTEMDEVRGKAMKSTGLKRSAHLTTRARKGRTKTKNWKRLYKELGYSWYE